MKEKAFSDFQKIGKGAWAGCATDEDWGNWHWQMRNQIRSSEDLAKHLTLTPNEQAGLEMTKTKLKLGVTPYFFNLIDTQNPECPLRRQVIPSKEECLVSLGETEDPCGEESYHVVSGLVHRYPDRVLWLLTDRCASYCRYCTRSRIVGGTGGLAFETDTEKVIAYLKAHEGVRDVLLSGGDPLLLSDEKLEHILESLRVIKHIEIVRIGTRVPIFIPQRITPALVARLKRHHPLFMSVHVNHPSELTAESRAALEMLADAGIPLGSQSVLLKGVNETHDDMGCLMRKLLRCRVRPYYLYQCDWIHGSAHFRVPVERGVDIIRSLRGFTTGYAVPQYVVDALGGGGKIPLNPNYVLEHGEKHWVFKNFDGKKYFYPGE